MILALTQANEEKVSTHCSTGQLALSGTRSTRSTTHSSGGMEGKLKRFTKTNPLRLAFNHLTDTLLRMKH